MFVDNFFFFMMDSLVICSLNLDLGNFNSDTSPSCSINFIREDRLNMSWSKFIIE